MTEVGLRVRSKSAGADEVKVTADVCERDPLAPVTVIVNVPLAEATHDRVELPALDMLLGARVQLIPDEGEADSVRVTVPVNPFRAPIVTVEVPVVLVTADIVVGLAVRV